MMFSSVSGFGLSFFFLSVLLRLELWFCQTHYFELQLIRCGSCSDPIRVSLCVRAFLCVRASLVRLKDDHGLLWTFVTIKDKVDDG
ncbi:hypothetical protein RJT34_25543 [Clitoria ternatea]|uniref:Uncharacterized protein n=1 Tax=Clitoria ternatea TaxID=43366 RepID=A0AAN9IIX5_CLITE